MIAQFQIINKVLQNKDYSLITLNNLTAEHFYGYKAEYEFIKAHYSNYHTVPDRLTFVQHFPEFVIQDVSEPDNYLIEQLYNDYNQSYLALLDMTYLSFLYLKYILYLQNFLQRPELSTLHAMSTIRRQCGVQKRFAVRWLNLSWSIIQHLQWL